MAAPLRTTTIFFSKNLLKISNETMSSSFNCKIPSRNFSRTFKNCSFATLKKNMRTGACVIAATSVFATSVFRSRRIYADFEARPVSRHVDGLVDIGNQRLTLYQFQSCPYCCKARAALDYFGFTYDVVEVNSLTKSQMKFSEYKKVPVLVVDGKIGEREFTLQFNDSSSIVSALGSYVFDQTTPLHKLHAYYPALKEKQRWKTVWEFPNKYFIMYGDKVDNRTDADRKDDSNDNAAADREERNWRQWTDDILMHTISPNVYRTPSESLEAFQHFSDWGEWEKHFSTATRVGIVYVGAFAMYFIGKLVKRRYNIKENPRESLYDACDEWMKAVGKNQFYGGDKPNLADLSVYGALRSFEGCLAHNELMGFHKIKDWYKRMEQQINGHQGAHLLNTTLAK